MTDNNHQITPSPELIAKWASQAVEAANCSADVTVSVATQAARWGYEQRAADIEDELQKARDEELEACCEWVEREIGLGREWGAELRAARRPKPLSLKEQALEAAQRFYANGHHGCSEKEIKDDFDTICRALESLTD